MKKYIIWIAVGALIIYLIFGQLIKKGLNANLLKPGINKVKFNLTWANITTALFAGVDAVIDMKIQNYTNLEYKLNNIYVEGYSAKDVLIFSQTQPFSEPIFLKPNQITTFEVPVNIAISGVYSMIGSANFSNLKTVFLKYINTGKYGLSMTIKGNLIAEDLKISLNEKTDI